MLNYSAKINKVIFEATFQEGTGLTISYERKYYEVLNVREEGALTGVNSF